MMTKAELEKQLMQEIHGLSFEAVETLLRLTTLLKTSNTPQDMADIQEQAILAQERAIHLQPGDMQEFLDALEHPPKPNAALKEDIKLHRQMLGDA